MIADGAQWHGTNFVLDNEPGMDELRDSLGDFMAVYCQMAALLTADWYNSLDRESRFVALPVSVVPPKRAADTAAWVFKGGGQTLNIETIANRTAAATYSMVFDAARDTVSTNATNEGVAYARVEEPGACDDCMSKATLLPKASDSSSDDVVWDRHQRCEFLFEPVRKGIWTPPENAVAWREQLQRSQLAGN